MSTFRQILYHIVFATKNRGQTLVTEHQESLYKYMWGTINNNKSKLYRINGMEDHIHILSDLHPSICLSDFVKDIKVSSSIWLKGSGMFPEFDSWQVGYGAFTYSVKEKPFLIEYIKNQKQHHAKETFLDEYKRILIENEIAFEEKYLL